MKLCREAGITPQDVANVKSELPNVTGKRGGKLYSVAVRGRLNPFASCYICGEDRPAGFFPMRGPCYQFAWETVARAHVTGKPLNFED